MYKYTANCKLPLKCKIFGHKFIKAEFIWHRCFRCGFDARKSWE